MLPTTASTPEPLFFLTGFPFEPFTTFEAAAEAAADLLPTCCRRCPVILIEQVGTGSWVGEVTPEGAVRY